MMNVRFAALSDTGLVRSRNEDDWAALHNLNFYAVADGMGGHPAGDIAAQAAVEAACEFAKGKTEEGNRLIAKAIESANEAVYTLSCADRSLKGMGTTLCCLALQGKCAYFGHVGDSRIYLRRGKELIQLTEDHSLVSQLIQAGSLRADEAQAATYRHVVTRAVGTRSKVLPSLGEKEVEEGDCFLLCTDGLSDLIGNEKIRDILNRYGDVEEVAGRLIEAATEAGGEDNVTVLLVEIV